MGLFAFFMDKMFRSKYRMSKTFWNIIYLKKVSNGKSFKTND